MPKHSISQHARRLILLCIGCLAVALGVIGIFLPIMPTTPFLLLAAACFVNSSDRFHHWLLHHPQLGPIIHPWLEGKGLPQKVKVYTLIALWFSLSCSAWILATREITFLLLLVGILISLWIIKLPSAES